MTVAYAIERLRVPPDESDLRDLAALVVDAVDSGAAVSFLAPLARERAEEWWRGITAATALRLAKYFRVSAELWMGLQAGYDLRVARRKVAAEIDRRVRPRVA